MKRISQSDLQNMYEPVPQNLQNDVDRIFSSLNDGEERIIVKKKLSASFILIAALVIMGTFALAAGSINLFRSMTDLAEPILPLPGAEKMVKTNIGSAENEYVTLNVEEAVFDGQSIITLVRITPKNIEKHAMLNAFMQGAPEEIYNTQSCPVTADEGEVEWEEEGNVYRLVNEKNEKSLTVNGEPAAFPTNPEEAEAQGIPLYLENDVLYYADQFEFKVTGRKDGRETIDWWMNVSVMGENAGQAEEHYSHTMNAEEQKDGSVLVWNNITLYGEMRDTVQIAVSSNITADGQRIPMEDITFELDKNEMECKVLLVPDDGNIGENIEILSAEIAFTKVRGYLTVEYAYKHEGDTDIFINLCDAAGNRIADGDGQMWKVGEKRYLQQMEIQSFEGIPGRLILEAKAIDGNILGECVCSVVND